MTDDFVADLLSATPKANEPGACKVCDSLAEMSDTRREALSSAIAGKIADGKVALIMTRHGYPTSESTVRKHRRKGH